MKLNLPAKIFIVVCLCLIAVLTFTACKDKEIYAESSDFESYPDYWNDFNNNNGDIYVPNNSNGTIDTDGISPNESNTSSETDDWTANLGDNDDENNTSSAVDTDKDGTPDSSDPDDDNDGVADDNDNDDDGDGTPDDDEDNLSNQGPLYIFN